MRDRCINPKNPGYRNYGGRGISVCAHWASDFAAFMSDMGPRPEGGTLERIDTNGDYEPRNCRWASVLEQMNNLRTNNNVTYKGETKSLSAWARSLGVSRDRIAWRLKRGWSVEEAFTMPWSRGQRRDLG